ncbi:uncharacterized protein M421DRAFT_98419 [Didymella exigua CBS 183.55]|uniref:ASST-domain-containing protein n=1 Tax=Didymella exigua CBS 183.55 TaxID=1150837 RepID=A0A6A5RXI6_9PLEO|nr:uncharacterized protein M421DRAFT_98419 [Didymella exigua CBS 183.55]KAF1932259.1 hypothetical protein M421DRAFT_98419 [Didymella exigua CBS 183.55]
MDGESTSGQNWPTMYDFSQDRLGPLAWIANCTELFDFKTQTYRGQPVLTFWSGEVLNGYGRGSYYILNESYVELVHFQANRFGSDMGEIHEFTITSDDTALIPVYHAIPWNLTETGGIENGWLFENMFQEINVETGETVFEWNASTHIGINESYNSLPEDDAAGDHLVSARVMDCIYKISGEDGHIIWRLGGKRSNFEIDDDAVFAFQHDARWVDSKNPVQIALFDNGPMEDIAYSRDLLLDVNSDTKKFTNAAKTFATFEGSMQVLKLSDGNMNYLVGYGSQPYFAELNAQGEILLDVQFGKTNAVNCYRAYKPPWLKKPFTKPDTECESWVVYTANSSDSSTWTTVTTARRTGFEATIDLDGVQLDAYVRGKAVNGSGTALGWAQASNGEQLFDARENVQQNGSVVSITASRTTPLSSATCSAATGSSTGVAARATQGSMESLYTAAAVVAGGLAFV